MNLVSKFLTNLKNEGARKCLENTINHIRYILDRRLKMAFSCDIGDNLPDSTKMPHPIGIVIANESEVGENVKIYQNVTIGANIGNERNVNIYKKLASVEKNKDKDKDSYPTIGDNVIIYSGAAIIGEIDIGENSIIGTNSVVKKDIPPNSIAVGTPAEVIQNKT